MAERTQTLNSQEEMRAFWEEEVTTKLDAEQTILLFVSHDFPDELNSVVQFLNKHTHDNLEILAVEIKQHRAQSSRASECRGEDEKMPEGAATNTARDCLCGCGAENNPGRNFNMGHDGRLNGWLTELKRGNFDVAGSLSYVSEMCRGNPDLFKSDDNPLGHFYKKYTPEKIIQLAEELAKHRRQN